jgi:GTP cyclohydrolase I
MRARGVRNNKASMMTTSLRGALKDDPTLRAEWLRSLPA